MTDRQPLTTQQYDEYQALTDAATAGPWAVSEDYSDVLDPYGDQLASFFKTADGRFIAAARTAVPALLAEVRRLRAAMEEIRHLHKDSPMGPCPVCIDADALAAGGDGLVAYPCPTGRLAGAQDCDPPHVRAARYSAAGNEMAASLVRDGFGDDEIADILARPAAAGSAAANEDKR